MTSIASSPLHIQACAQAAPVPPWWFGELTIIVQLLQHQGVLTAIEEQVRFARRRFGHYDVIDFVAVLIGYAISGERTLEAFYERIDPWAEPFMALFGRDRLPARSTLSRFLAALDQTAVEALRTVFLQDLLVRSLPQEGPPDGLFDRQGKHFRVFDVDGTREAARQRTLSQTTNRPAPVRRLRPLCAPGYTGRKCGEVVRTRTTVLQAHTHQWLATFGNAGNGRYRVELRRALSAKNYLRAFHLPISHALVRLDGQYGTKAVLLDLADIGYVTRGKDYRILDQPAIQARLTLPPDQPLTQSESGIVRTLYDCPDQPLDKSGEKRSRVIVATHPAGATKSRIGVTRNGVVYELFLTNLPPTAFTAADVVALYLHRGSFELALADEDQEQDPDRWCSHAACGQEAWQIVSQWVWNLRLELGHHLHPDPARTTACASAHQETAAVSAPPQGYAPASAASSWKTGCFTGNDFALQSDGTLRCLAGASLTLHERRQEANGSLRLVYGASIQSCRPCPLCEQCQWEGSHTAKPRQVSLLLHPLARGEGRFRWRDWSRRFYRRACMQLVRFQRLEVESHPALAPPSDPAPDLLSRAQRAHSRLTFPERLARNARSAAAGRLTITLCGVPQGFATFLGLASL